MITNHVGSFCALCRVSTESASHLFVLCRVTSMNRYRINRWLEWEWILPRDLVGLFKVLLRLVEREKIIRGFLLVWHTVVWSI